LLTELISIAARCVGDSIASAGVPMEIRFSVTVKSPPVLPAPPLPGPSLASGAAT
jgi:hypothetical protein